jgi:hypothetical protein
MEASLEAIVGSSSRSARRLLAPVPVGARSRTGSHLPISLLSERAIPLARRSKTSDLAWKPVVKSEVPRPQPTGPRSVPFAATMLPGAIEPAG